MTGDPHVRTLDQVRYDLQAAGEFVGIRSLDDDLEVQYRLEAAGRPASVSYVTAVAVKVGAHKVMLAAGLGPRLRIDGDPVQIPHWHTLTPNEGGMPSIARIGERYFIIWPDGSNLNVTFRGRFLDAFFLPSENRKGRFVGLFGDGDGDTENDFRTRAGEMLTSPPPFDALYRKFADSWRVRPDESLFQYEPGESIDTFTDTSVPASPATLDHLAPADRVRAEAACRSAGVEALQPLEECIIDVGYTGDETFIVSALAQQTPPRTESADPQPLIVSGRCQATGADTITASLRADPGRTGRYDDELREFHAERRWSLPRFRGGHDPLIVNQSVIAAKESTLTALDPETGHVLWEVDGAGGRISGRGFVAAGGIVYASWEGGVAAYDLDSGIECWRLAVGRVASPVFADGRVFVSVDEGETGYLLAVDAWTGQIVWRHVAVNSAPANWPNPSAPTVGNGAIFIADGKEVLALDVLSGEVRWRATTGRGVSEWASYADGAVYVPDRSGGLHSLDAKTGAIRWSWSEAGLVLSMPVALSDGLVFLTDGRHLHAIDSRAGSEVWKVQAERSAQFSAPSVIGDRLYAITHEGVLVVLDAATGGEIQRVKVGHGTGWVVPVPGEHSLYFILPNGILNAYR